MKFRIREADLLDPDHASATVEIIDSYARGAGGQNAPLSELARANMAKGLSEHPDPRSGHGALLTQFRDALAKPVFS